MPIGAAVGTAVVGGGAAILGSKANSKAIGQASDAQAQATAQATALQRDIYNQNVAIQQPFLNTGNAAMGQINALLGLNPVASPGTPGGPGGPAVGQAAQDSLFAMQHDGIPGNFAAAIQSQHPEIAAMQHDGIPGNYAAAIANLQSAPQPAAPAPAPAPAAGTPAAPAQPTQTSANAAYDQFKNYTGYQTRLNEGNNALNSGYAASGTLQSGAALKGLTRFNQDYASNEFGNYMGYLGGQQQLGPGAANALSGVGTNYANAAGNLAIQGGNNVANAAIASANNKNQMWSGIGSAVGGLFGNAFGGSSFGG